MAAHRNQVSADRMLHRWRSPFHESQLAGELRVYARAAPESDEFLTAPSVLRMARTQFMVARAAMVMGGLPRPERPQVCGRRVPRMRQGLQDAVQLRHLDGREVPVRRPGVGGDLLRAGGTGYDAAHLGMRQ